MIQILFPNSPIIHCVRDPMDNCWSLYKQLFVGSHLYCYDQAALGRYYLRYQRLMKYWHHVLPGRIHDVSYEKMVKEPEATIRAMLDYCKLSWEPQCLQFYRTKRTVNTASMWQVRRPIYSSAVHSWHAYAEQLKPLHAALKMQ